MYGDRFFAGRDPGRSSLELRAGERQDEGFRGPRTAAPGQALKHRAAPRPWRALLAVSFVAAGLAGRAGSASGQAVSGRVLDVVTDSAIVLARVRLLDSAGVALSYTVSGNEGWFLLAAPGPGRYYLHAESGFYKERLDGPLVLAAGDTALISYHLEPDPAGLDPIIVEARSRRIALQRAGFYERERTGLGRFLTREKIEARSARYITDLFAAMPGVTLVRGQFGRREVIFRSGLRFATGGVEACYPRVFIDGMMRALGGSTPTGLDDLLRPDEVEAVEVYRGAAEIPGQYGGSMAGCGVILIWTRVER